LALLDDSVSQDHDFFDHEHDDTGFDSDDDASATTASEVANGGAPAHPVLEKLRVMELNLQHLQAQHAALHLDMYFPRSEGWTMRAFIPEESMYFGAKDLGIERLDSVVDLRAGNDGINLNITDVFVSMQIYQLRFNGKTGTARALKRLLSPEKVSLTITGKVHVPIVFKTGRRSRWRCPRRPQFSLKIHKKISNAVGILPDSFVRSLLNTVMPRVVKQAVKALPKELGPFLGKARNEFCYLGSFAMAETIPRDIWTSPLHSCPEACELLGLTREEVAVLCAVVSKGRVSKITEPTLDKTLSMEALWMYVLKNKSSSVDEWAELVKCWDYRLNAVAPKITGTGWVGGLFERLAEVGRKPLTVQLQIKELEVHVSVRDVMQVWETVYLKGVELLVKKTLDKQQHLVPSGGTFKTPAEYQASAQQLVSLVRRLVDVSSRTVDSVAATTDVAVRGGSVLFTSFTVSKMSADAALPDALDLFIPSMHPFLPATQVKTHVGENGSYHIDLTWYHFGTTSNAVSPAVQALAALGEADEAAEGVAGGTEEERDQDSPALLNVKLYLEAVAVDMRQGRLHTSSEAMKAEVAVHNSMLSQTFADIARISALRHNSVLNRGDSSVDVEGTTQEDFDQAVVAFFLPLLFDSEHRLNVCLERIKCAVTTSGESEVSQPTTSEATGSRSEQGSQGNTLEMSLVAMSEGTIELQLPLSKLVTEALDISEIKNRLVRESLFADSDDIGIMRTAASESGQGALEFDDMRVTEEQVQAEFGEFEQEDDE